MIACATGASELILESGMAGVVQRDGVGFRTVAPSRRSTLPVGVWAVLDSGGQGDRVPTHTAVVGEAVAEVMVVGVDVTSRRQVAPLNWSCRRRLR